MGDRSAEAGGRPPASQPLLRGALLVAGLVIPQLLLYGPCFLGQRILLPLDILKMANTYLPPEEYAHARLPNGTTIRLNLFRPQNHTLSDIVQSYEIERRFVAAELREGRIPLWAPYNYAGAPFVNWPKYSPYSLIYCLFPSPYSLVWLELIRCLVAGSGAYLFFRRAVSLSFWPSVVAAWCFPLTGHFVLWQGFPQTYVTPWLPWCLLITFHVVRRPGGWSGPALAVVTALILVSGQIDTAGHVLLASGLYAIYCLWTERAGSVFAWKTVAAVAVLAGGWASGFLLSAPELLPLVEYATQGERLRDVDAIVKDRPPVGISSLPRIVLPRIDGSPQLGWFHLQGRFEFESAAAAYTGILATLLAAPLAWFSKPHRGLNVFWLLLAVFALSWELNIPGFVHVFKLPLLNLRPHNRFVCVASFAILALAATGLEAIRDNRHQRASWFRASAALLVLVGAFCAYRLLVLPEPVATEMARAVRAGAASYQIPDMQAVTRIQTTFRVYYLVNLAVCLVGTTAWFWLWSRPSVTPRFRYALGLLLCGELLLFAYGTRPQCDPELDYPKIPVLEKLAQLPPGRVLGIECLPPKLNEIHGLEDIRGYDGVDPLRYVELLLSCQKQRGIRSPHYAKTLYFVPQMRIDADGAVRLPPVMDMLGLRYLIYPGAMPPEATPIPALRELMHEHSYYVVENKNAMPRAYVPKQALFERDGRRILEFMNREEFDPRAVAYLEEEVMLPDDCRGTAKIVSASPMEVTMHVDMETDGLVILADRWDRGWRATSGGRQLPVLRANYVLRAVVVPRGEATIVLRYEPASFWWGVRLMLAAVAALLVWVVALGAWPWFRAC